jgi:hypothetical protein
MMNKRWVVLSASVLLLIMAMIVTPAAAQDPGPVTGALATLAAATAQAQMIRQAQEATYAAQRATIQAVMIEQTRTAAQMQASATRQAFSVQGTATALSAQATQSALDELNRQRAMTATSQAQNLQATRNAQEAAATAAVLSSQATSEAYQAQATRLRAIEAVAIAAQATDAARLSETYATRQERFSLGLLIVEVGFIIGALLIIGWLTRTLVLWAKRLAPQPVSDAALLDFAKQNRRTNLAEVMTHDGAVYSAAEPTVIEQQAEPEARMPEFVQVVDDPRIVEALDRWAERFDASAAEDHGGTHAG